jgi:aspartate racemase
MAAFDIRQRTAPAAFHELFEHHALQAPDATALCVSEVAVSYAELNARANRLAGHLATAGVRQGTVVAIYLPRSIELVVSMLATLKAGGTFLALDRAYPEARRQQILADAEPPVLITLTSMRIMNFTGHTVDVDGQWLTSAADDGNPGTVVAADSVAYIIYTSGTTGRPKGTLLTHRGLCNYASALQPLAIAPGDVYLCTASFSFSSSIRQVLVPLSAGATVVIATGAEIADPIQLFTLINQRHVTIIDLVPSYWRTCTRVLERVPAPTRAALLRNSLRTILSASEPLRADLPRTWRHEFGHTATFVNGYGHTETTGLVSLFTIPDALLEDAAGIPIGPPLANTAFDILDDHGRPVPVGDTGELYVRGASLARGYLNRPDLDAERFVSDPAGRPAERRYRTGDIVRRLSEDTLAFVGRRDQQVKVNGVRVELNEVESVLDQHPLVDEAAVFVEDDGADDPRLVACVVVPTLPADIGELRAFLGARLPAPMIPSEFRVVAALPRTPSGKIDRAQLSTLSAPPATRVLDEPTSDVQRVIAGVWREALRLEQVDVDANFFELGGDSLKAMEVIAVLQERFPTDVPMLALFFEEPTVAALARAVQETSSQDAALAGVQSFH